ncbi:MAG TPA: ATP-binding cassette domain-containing protein [Steroidobacteraceae bacterium]|nr:ATP-binding cassette domain-containing protein [Steroidobacteraceae bacterium]
MTGAAIRADRLTKRYGETLAVDGIDLAIEPGQFFGLLGPNGAGKTSTIHMLSTLIRPTSGEAWVMGNSVRTHKLAVRRSIGVVFQEAALDRTLSVAENLRFAGALNDLPRAEIRRRSAELLELFGLTHRRDHTAAALSGGMRRALDIARGVIHQPQILFLDEPTIGLDLPNRRAIWRHIARLRAELGITVLLTTHYLEEAADCDEVAFLSAGRIVRQGNPRALTETLGAYIVEVETHRPQELAEQLAPRLGAALIEGERLQFCCDREPADLAALQAELAVTAQAVRWRRPNLNDVFLWVNHSGTSQKRAA